jgi:GR25 family glycosyltransferase involved in LPS biosynthesis
MASPYHGYYINLERSTARRRALEQRLLTLGLENVYSRFPAIDGSTLSPRAGLKPGELGAFHSHVGALKAARGSSGCVHIVEDDAVLSEHVRPVLDSAITANLFDRYDILFTDMFVNCHLGLLKHLKLSFRRIESPPERELKVEDLEIIDLAQQNFSCLTSYAVGPRSIDRLLALYHQEIAAGPRTAVDIFVRDCVLSGQLRAACLFPFVTTFDLKEVANSTIANANRGAADASVMVMAVLRYSFFVGRDLALAQTYLDEATRARAPADRHEQLIAQAVGFVLSDAFSEF